LPVSQGASNLPLQVGPNLPGPVQDSSSTPPHTISITYLTPAQAAEPALAFPVDAEGQGGPRYDPMTGQILSGWIVIRTDPTTDPSTITGQHVLEHEAIHTLNVAHAAHGSGEIMEPALVPGASPTLGAGDRYALAVVGCTAPTS